MIRTYAFLTLAAFSGAFALTGCNNVKQQLGLEKSAPDEFAVVKEAPLAMPPDYGLRPPRPGMERPQDTPTIQQAQETVFGGADDQNAQPRRTGSNSAILQMAGADNANPDIRRQVDRESALTGPKRSTALQKLHVTGPAPTPANVVNAPAEAARLNKDAQTGKPLTSGETPGVQQ